MKVQIIGNVVLGSSGIALKKGSPYTKFLNEVWLKLYRSGQIIKLKSEYESKNVCDPMLEEDGTSLTYQKLFLLFAIIAGAMMLALLIMLFEILLHSHFKSKDMPREQFEILTHTYHQESHNHEISKPEMVNSTTKTCNF